MTNHYELLYLVGANIPEEDIDPIRQTVRDLIGKFKGNIIFEDNFGKKKLAYPVNKNHQGYYLMTDFDLDGSNLDELNKSIGLTNEILRHIIVKRNPNKAPTRLNLSDTPATDARKKSFDNKNDVRKPKSSEAPAATEETKINIENLDEKLDEILEGDIM